MTEPAPLRLDDQLCFALYAATNAVTRAYRPLLAKLGLTYPQYLAMLVLWQDGECSVGHIAARLGLPPNAIGPLVDRLEEAGLVSRSRLASDRRVIHVSLTERGAGLERPAAEAQLAVVCRTELAPDELTSLRDELISLVDRMEPGGAASHIEAPNAQPCGVRESQPASAAE